MIFNINSTRGHTGSLLVYTKMSFINDPYISHAGNTIVQDWNY